MSKNKSITPTGQSKSSSLYGGNETSNFCASIPEMEPTEALAAYNDDRQKTFAMLYEKISNDVNLRSKMTRWVIF